eukprot:2838453-Amphidinium_carterae.1
MSAIIITWSTKRCNAASQIVDKGRMRIVRSQDGCPRLQQAVGCSAPPPSPSSAECSDPWGPRARHTNSSSSTSVPSLGNTTSQLCEKLVGLEWNTLLESTLFAQDFQPCHLSHGCSVQPSQMS